jgi:hypothetical protein
MGSGDFPFERCIYGSDGPAEPYKLGSWLFTPPETAIDEEVIAASRD